METLVYKLQKTSNFGFHIQNDGLITEVEVNSPADVAGLAPSSRLISINAIKTEGMNAECMIELLKGNEGVELGVIAPEVVR